jgi:hypothetical protein
MASGNTVTDSGVTRWDTAGRRPLTEGQNDYMDTYGTSGNRNNPSFSTSTLPKPGAAANNQASIDALIAAITKGYGGGSGSSGTNSAASTASSRLGMAELAYKKQQDAAEAALALQTKNEGLAKDASVLGKTQDFYNTGAYGKEFDRLIAMSNAQGNISEEQIGGAYKNALAAITGGYDTAKGLGDSGYRALNAYLAANPNDPYAGMQATVGSAPDALTQYLGAYGVSDQPVQGQIQADQLQAQQGAGNFNNLTNVLSAIAQSGASSRGAESAMGQNLFNTELGSERAGYQGKAATQQQTALNSLQQQLYRDRMEQESARSALANQLIMQILAANGDVDGDDGDESDEPAELVKKPVRKTGLDIKPSPAAAYKSPEQIAMEAGRLTEDQARALEARRGRNGY